MDPDEIEIKKSATKGSFVNLIANSVVKIIAIVFYILILNYLPEAQADLFFIGFAILGFVRVIGGLGIPVSVLRFVPYYMGQGKEEKIRPLVRKMGTYLLILGIITAVILFISADFIAQTFGQKQLETIIYLIALTMPLALFYEFFSSLIRGLKHFYVYSGAVTLQNLTKMGALLFFVSFVASTAYNAVLSIIIAFVVAISIMGTYSMYKLKKYPQSNKPFKKIRQVFNYGIPMYVSNLGSFLSNWTDSLALGLLIPTAGVVAGYNAVVLIARNVGPVVSMPLSQIMKPIFSRLHGKRKDLREYAKEYSKWCLFLGLPILIIFSIMSHRIMFLVFNKYSEFHWLLWVTAPTFFVTLLGAPFRDALWAIGRTRIFILSSIIIVIPNIILNFALIPLIGVLGAAIASAITYILSQSIYIYYGKKDLDIWFHKDALKILVMTIISGIVLFIANGYLAVETSKTSQVINLIILICITVAIYLAMAIKWIKLFDSIKTFKTNKNA